MFKDERELTNHIIREIILTVGVKRAIKGDVISKKPFKDFLQTYFNMYAPELLAKPDIVMVFEDVTRGTDDWFLVSVELKYFKANDRLNKRLRKAFREIGQPLRYHLYGFDATILWHIFEENIDIEIIQSYSNLISEIIERLRLPIVYFSTRITKKEKDNLYFLVIKPTKVDSPKDINYIVTWMLNLTRNTRNPLLPQDKEVEKRRRVLKTVLGIP